MTITSRLGSADGASGEHVRFDLGDGTPVRGRGRVSVEPADRFDVKVSECNAQPSGSAGVRARCRAQVGDKEVEADVAVEIGP